MCLFLQDLDRSLRLLCQGCELALLLHRGGDGFLVIEIRKTSLSVEFHPGGKAAEGAADGDEGTQRNLNGP